MAAGVFSRPALRRWLFKGVATPQGGAVLHYRRVYILPTRNGLMFGVMLFIIWLGAINYNNSLAFVLVFTLAALAVVSILHTFRNLVGLRLRVPEPEPVFAGDTARFPVLLDNQSRKPRLAIGLQCQGVLHSVSDVAPHRSGRVELRQATVHRGWIEAPRCSLFTIHPLGLFKAWSWLDLSTRCLVYPAPESGPVPAPAGVSTSGTGGRRGSGSEDFDGLRRYRPGDSPRQVAWRLLAREQPLQTKQFTGEARSKLWLDWNSLDGMEAGARIARLTRWVLDAEREGRRYGLSLPGQTLPPAQGPAHRHRCLRALALFGS